MFNRKEDLHSLQKAIHQRLQKAVKGDNIAAAAVATNIAISLLACNITLHRQSHVTKEAALKVTLESFRDTLLEAIELCEVRELKNRLAGVE